MIAVAAKNEGMVSYLLSAKADPNILDAEGLSALAYAVLTEQPNMLKILVQGGADINAKDKQGNSLGYVVEYSQLSQVKKKEMLKALTELGFEG
jgi:ankyrin repeat protein